MEGSGCVIIGNIHPGVCAFAQTAAFYPHDTEFGWAGHVRAQKSRPTRRQIKGLAQGRAAECHSWDLQETSKEETSGSTPPQESLRRSPRRGAPQRGDTEETPPLSAGGPARGQASEGLRSGPAGLRLGTTRLPPHSPGPESHLPPAHWGWRGGHRRPRPESGEKVDEYRKEGLDPAPSSASAPARAGRSV